MTPPRSLFVFKAVLFVTIFVRPISKVQSAEPLTESAFIAENDQVKRVGDEVSFSCRIKNPRDRPLLWMKIDKINRSQQFVIAMDTKPITEDRFTVDYNKGSSEYVLRISRLEANDTGFYQCQILLDASNKVYAEVKLDIERPPEITAKSPSSVTVREGESIDLQCQADGFPIPVVTWEREYGDIMPSGDTRVSGNVLSIQSADKSDRGNYYCIANNTIEPTEKTVFKVSVEFAPVVYTPRPKIGQARGHDAKLQCHIEANPTPSVTWLKNGKVIATETPHASGDEFVHIHRVNVIDRSDYGRYTCRVENMYGAADAVVELFETQLAWISDKD